jgi:hypothetical protein
VQEEPLSGFKLSMMLSNQLSLSGDSQVKALNRKGKSVTATTTTSKLVNTMHVSLLLALLVASKAGQLVWANKPDAVPTKDNTAAVHKKSMHA